MSQQVTVDETRGFSLIELLIVVAIILVIAAIAVPNFLRTKMAANAASAVQSLRTLNTAEISYSTTFAIGYSASLTQLGPPAAGNPVSPAGADLIDVVFAGGQKSGYQFVYTPSAGGAGGYQGYTVNANPILPGSTGSTFYYTDQSQVIRVDVMVPASSTDSPIPQ